MRHAVVVFGSEGLNRQRLRKPVETYLRTRDEKELPARGPRHVDGISFAQLERSPKHFLVASVRFGRSYVYLPEMITQQNGTGPNGKVLKNIEAIALLKDAMSANRAYSSVVSKLERIRRSVATASS